MAAGFIYVMTNEAMPGLVKIGKTTKLPTERARELYTTGVPNEFEVKFAILVDDIDEWEKEIHKLLDEFRVSESREFFSGSSAATAMWILRKYSQAYGCTIVSLERAIEVEDHLRYASICGVPFGELVKVLKHVSDASWKDASDKYRCEIELHELRDLFRQKTAEINEEPLE